eukprot:GGOE01025040.1.p2 GENE.GGOE01025040.1~~GGOE01025040.1.p2  ORF type:complete len:112 (+),score=3.82 GGOE01025040.1:219-554(+)
MGHGKCLESIAILRFPNCTSPWEAGLDAPFRPNAEFVQGIEVMQTLDFDHVSLHSHLLLFCHNNLSPLLFHLLCHPKSLHQPSNQRADGASDKAKDPSHPCLSKGVCCTNA